MTERFLKQVPGVTKKDIRDMYALCMPTISRILKTSLNNIQNTCKGISWRKTYRFYSSTHVYIDSKKTDFSLHQYIATPDDVNTIDTEYKRAVLDEMEMSTEWVVHQQNRTEEFYEKILSLFNKEQGTHYNEFYQEIEISVKPAEFFPFFNSIEKELLSTNRQKENIQRCNTLFIELLEKNTNRKADEYISTFSQEIRNLIETAIISTGDIPETAILTKYSTHSINMQEMCRNTFIRL